MKRHGKITHLLLFALMPITMLSGIATINSVGKINLASFLTETAARLCVIDDFQKIALVVMGAVAGVIIGFIFRLEEDADFAKRNYIRRIGYMTVSLLTSVCCTPYLLMRISDDQPKPLCLLMGACVAASAWLILEIFYSRAKAYFTILLNKLMPIPPEKDKPNENVSKDQGTTTK